jgi:hypothetical protein
LDDENTGMASETLSATILLAFYEMFASNSNDSWIRHAGGAGALMQVRGPDRHRYGFDREIFLAFRNSIIIQSFERDEGCFLSRPEWRAVSQDIHEDIRSSGINQDQMDFFDLGEEFYQKILDLPGLLHDGKHFRKEFRKQRRYGFPTTAEFKTDLIRRCHESRTGLKLFFAKFRLCLVRLGYDFFSVTSGDPVVPIFYNYPNVMVASTCTGYWTVLIILNFELIELQLTDKAKVALLRTENREAGLEICRSTAYLLTSTFLGPFFQIQGLRVCLLAFEHPDERDWVVRKLLEIGESHMGMAAHIPGFSPGEGLGEVRASLNAMNGFPRLGLEDVSADS